MATVRRYLTPPKNQRSKKKGPGSPKGDAGSFLRDHRNELAPYVVAWFYLLAVTIFAKTDFAPFAYFGVSAGLSALIFFEGHKIRSIRQFVHRPKTGKRSLRARWRLAYILAVPFVGAVWGLWATMPNSRDTDWHRPSMWAYVVFLIVVSMAAGPWLFVLRSSKKTMLTMVDLSREDQIIAIQDAKTVINDWIGWSSAAGLQGARLRGLTFSRWSRCIHIEMRRGSTTLNFTPLRMNRIENASLWDISPGMARVDHSDISRQITVRYMLEDPHAESLDPPEFEDMNDKEITLGMFEDASTVFFEWVNTLIGGLTRQGKSGLVNVLIRAFAKIPHVAILGVDLKPGAPELGPWASVMAGLADSPEKAIDMFQKILFGLQRRGDLMQQRGWKVWRPTRKEPFIVLIIDEIQKLDRKTRKMVADIAAIIGAYGGIVIVATQYPIKENLPSELKQNLDQRIGFRTSDDQADRVIFGNDATRRGWKPSELCPAERKGSFMIRNAMHTRPILARGWYEDEVRVERDAASLAKHLTMIDSNTWDEVAAANEQAMLEDESAVMSATQVTTEDLVIEAIEIGHGTPKKIAAYTGIPLRTVELFVRRLADAKEIEQDAQRKPWRVVSKE